ncbi:hypothetical protein BHE97_14985 [Aeromicrobium sp. PE09-221]|uniref:transglutaminase family protein n=1 Tax=Aeromicrobium sp. PE09-221 TaxID=1898043 RepID=UPI000B69D14D|nr:transglutaminase family protein [Aeromicrobium sp. PE09-221]OUZ07999.1 hypothetical protein BHE97_14985 [Aeromicrobium sp. PE09-221]
MTRYQVRHRTSYAYDAPVTGSYGLAWVMPRRTPGQEVTEAAVTVVPEPEDLGVSSDYYGNEVRYFHVTVPHTELVVDADSVVEVEAAEPPRAMLDRSWETCRPLGSAEPGAWLAADFALESPLVEHPDSAREYAAVSLSPGRSIGEAVAELVHRVHADFAYRPGVTSVTSTVDEVFAARAGVCQDFTHLLLSCLRSHGLAARYVSGYLATTPPPGRERLVGADASHAWAAVWLGDDDWLAVDPTNDTRVDDRYVTVAWGRDYGDVPPVKGTVFTTASSSELTVYVDVQAV